MWALVTKLKENPVKGRLKLSFSKIMSLQQRPLEAKPYSNYNMDQDFKTMLRIQIPG